MAKKNSRSTSTKLSVGYRVTLWVIGIALFLAFAFATFCACGGLKLMKLSPPTYVSSTDADGNIRYDGDDGSYYVLDPAGNIILSADSNGNVIYDASTVSASDSIVTISDSDTNIVIE